MIVLIDNNFSDQTVNCYITTNLQICVLFGCYLIIVYIIIVISGIARIMRQEGHCMRVREIRQKLQNFFHNYNN